MSAQVRLFGFQIDAVVMREAVERLTQWIDNPDGTCRYVVTPNADHAVMYQEHAGLREAYAGASLVLADGMPLVVAARLLRRRLPQRVAGSDLVPTLFQSIGHADRPLKVFLLGAGPGVADRAARNIALRWPNVHVVGTHCPPLGFEREERENERILEHIAATRPDVLIVGLGAPKQELWVHAHREQIRATVAVCAGASIDFLAGEKRRAPVWMRHAGLEWLHRLASEPGRLWQRYMRDAWIFPQLVSARNPALCKLTQQVAGSAISPVAPL